MSEGQVGSAETATEAGPPLIELGAGERLIDAVRWKHRTVFLVQADGMGQLRIDGMQLPSLPDGFVGECLACSAAENLIVGGYVTDEQDLPDQHDGDYPGLMEPEDDDPDELPFGLDVLRTQPNLDTWPVGGRAEVRLRQLRPGYVVLRYGRDWSPVFSPTDALARPGSITDISCGAGIGSPTGEITGTVTTEKHQPVAGLSVDLFLARPDGLRSTWLTDATTDSAGCFRFAVDPRDYVLVYIAPDGMSFEGDRQFVEQHVTVSDGQTVEVKTPHVTSGYDKLAADEAVSPAGAEHTAPATSGDTRLVIDVLHDGAVRDSTREVVAVWPGTDRREILADVCHGSSFTAGRTDATSFLCVSSTDSIDLIELGAAVVGPVSVPLTLDPLSVSNQGRRYQLWAGDEAVDIGEIDMAAACLGAQTKLLQHFELVEATDGLRSAGSEVVVRYRRATA